MERDELAAWLRLCITPTVGNGTARRLLATFGLPTAIFSQDELALRSVASSAQVHALREPPEGLEALVDTTWAWLEAAPQQHRIVTLADDAYPLGLLHTEDPPLLLYLSGVPVASWPAAVAVVGSRNPTPQGAANARQFACSLAQAGLTVVSGLALGVDGAAHDGALEGAAPGQLATIAVVGTGLDRVYPKRHLSLAHRIVERGLIVSEFPLGTGPLAENFPRRNRIISALGQGTLVVEAAMQSGSLITARMSLEQGRDVFAIPGSIHSPQSRGCHSLIKQGAKLVETAQDILEELRVVPSRAGADAAANEAAATPTRDAADPPAKADPLLAALGFDPVGLEALIARTGLPIAALQARLLELELDGLVARLPGGLFQRLVTA
jgi:DNA processing protein